MGTQRMHMPRLSAELGAEVRVAWRSDSVARWHAASSVVRIGLLNFREGKGGNLKLPLLQKRLQAKWAEKDLDLAPICVVAVVLLFMKRGFVDPFVCGCGHYICNRNPHRRAFKGCIECLRTR